jgi:hypothetical protein
MIQRQGATLSKYFESEEEFLDLMTKRIMEERVYSDDDDDLGDDDKYHGFGAASYMAKAKQKQVK